LALDLHFPKRAVQTFVDAARAGKLGPRHISDITRYEDVDVSPIEIFLFDVDPWVRQCAAKVISARGDKKKLVEVAKNEKDKMVLMTVIEGLTHQKEGLEDLAHMLSDKDSSIVNDVIQMFRRAGRTDCLLALAFSNDDAVVARVKKYMEDQDAAAEKESGS
jgi:hypothetical protein